MPEKLLTGPWPDNQALNQALCEAKARGVRVAFSEKLGGVMRASVRKVATAEARRFREDMGLDAGGGEDGLYEAKVSQSDKMNLNGRIYPKKVMQANIDRLQPLLKEGYLTGAVDHIGDDEGGNLKHTPIIWRELSMDSDGAVMGKFEVVEGHSDGANLKAQLDAGMAVGISTYGYGNAHEATEDEQDEYDVPDGCKAAVMGEFELKKADAVDDPSVPDARVVQDGRAVTKNRRQGKDSRAGGAKKENAAPWIVNGYAIQWAEYAIKHGLINGEAFDPESVPRDALHGAQFLGLDSAFGKDEPEHYQLAIICGSGQVSAEAVCAIAARTDKTTSKDIHAAAEKLKALIQAKDPNAIKTPEKYRPRPAGAMVAAEVVGLAQKISEKADRQPLTKRYAKYFQSDNAFEPTGNVKLAGALDNDAYRVVDSWSGVAFVRMRPQTDNLYKFPGSIMERVLKEIDDFWQPETSADYAKFGVLYNRGILLEGPPGTGKSSICNQVAEQIVDSGDVVFYSKSISTLSEALHAFREVEPDRKVVCILEDADEYVGYQERQFLNLLDGEESVSGVLYVATTNYAERFPPRLLRPGRFDKRIVVGYPPIEGRRAYLKAKLEKYEPAEEIERLATETSGLSFGHLRELITAVYAMREPKDAVLARLKGKAPRAADSTANPASGTTLREVAPKSPRLYGQLTVAEGRESQGETQMAEQTKPVTETNKPNAALNKAVAEVLTHLRDSSDIELPVREVLPAEFAERMTTIEGQVAERDAKLVEKDKQITALTTEVAGLKAEKATVARLAKINAKADSLTKDNKFRAELLEDVAEAATDPSFDETKVEALVTAKATRYGKLAEKAGGQSGTLEPGVLGRAVTDEDFVEHDQKELESQQNQPAAEKAKPGVLAAVCEKRK